MDDSRVTAEATTPLRVAAVGLGYWGPNLARAWSGLETADLRWLCDLDETNLERVGTHHPEAAITTDLDEVLADPEVEAISIATAVPTHARLALRALHAGKHVFVEKPLCLTLDELEQIAAVYRDPWPLLMVGFNRRFAPQVQKMRALLASTPGPKSIVVTVNAGAVPPSHWTQDAAIGGGRIIGEGCHFIDLARHLAGAPISGHSAHALASVSGDSATIGLTFEDGSIAAIHYLAAGSKAFPKERVEVFAGGRVLQLDNFRRLTGFGWPTFSSMRLWRQNKGQRACAKAFVSAIESGGPAPIPLDELLEVSRVTIDIAKKCQR